MTEDFDENVSHALKSDQNRKIRKSGGFQSYGLSRNIFRGIMKIGYKVPTPIQRKIIPLLLNGKDVVSMARTGSGKTAAFLIPLLEKLKVHTGKVGARAVILSPTRELAMQTLRFTRDLSKFTNLRTAIILGGDSMQEQFSAMHENPDIIIATPGRLMHVMEEMDLKLQFVEFVVFDEADQLFELGFHEQLMSILRRLPEGRQTALISATLPKLLAEFAQAGLHEPELVRLDVESKLSENLKQSFVHCKSEDKAAVLLYILRNVIKSFEQVVVFVATKHHVEYLRMVLEECGLDVTYSYSSLDQTARKINVAKFRAKKSRILLVTDIAARGIDIPLLDCVVNFNFPAKPKLFVHRVGRVARAGRNGSAISLICYDELAYVIDLHLFLNRPLNLSSLSNCQDSDNLMGIAPQQILDSENEYLSKLHGTGDIQSQVKVIANAYAQYLRTRPTSSLESSKKAKKLDLSNLIEHPLFGMSAQTETEKAQKDFLHRVRAYKAITTIFEINSKKSNAAMDVMKQKREFHNKKSKWKNEKEENMEKNGVIVTEDKSRECFIPYRPSDEKSEKGLGVTSDFDRKTDFATLDLLGDDEKNLKKNQTVTTWDRKRKKFVKLNPNEKNVKKIKTESGAVVKNPMKKHFYKDWLKNINVAEKYHGDVQPEKMNAMVQRVLGRNYKNTKEEVFKSENLVNRDKILKERKRKKLLRDREKWRRSANAKKKKKGMKKN